jgi:peptide methionine sulfoxide reductase msrA/msrB
MFGLLCRSYSSEKYYKAEDYHQDYLENNPGGYCHINPELFKVAKNANKKNDQ